MAQVTHFFAGANSGDGFQNLFSEIVDLEDTYDLMVLKGGPGVGKATFMREIGRSMEEAGTPVEYLWCSGDPDSLDGVVLPELRCAVVDGTSPHVVEPRYPRADPHLQCARRLAGRHCSAGSPHAARIPRLTPQPSPARGRGRLVCHVSPNQRLNSLSDSTTSP